LRAALGRRACADAALCFLPPTQESGTPARAFPAAIRDEIAVRAGGTGAGTRDARQGERVPRE